MSWYEEWFDEEYILVYGHRDAAEARRDIEFAQEALALSPQDRILDLCCGNGRHLSALSDQGFAKVVGIDLSFALLSLARDTLNRSDSFPGLVQSDMRHLPFNRCFNAVLNLFTSFGYFESDEENLQVLQAMSDCLCGGGRFILDYLNPERVIQYLEARSERIVEGRRVVETRRHDRDARRIEKHILIEHDGDKKEYSESVRLYSHEEMLEMFSVAGLSVDQTLGGFDKSSFTNRSPRMLFVGRKSPSTNCGEESHRT